MLNFYFGGGRFYSFFPQVKELKDLLPFAPGDAENFELCQLRTALVGLDGVVSPLAASEKIKAYSAEGLDKDVVQFLAKIVGRDVEMKCEEGVSAINKLAIDVKTRGPGNVADGVVENLEKYKKDVPRHGKIPKSLRCLISHSLDIAMSTSGRDLHSKFVNNVAGDGKLSLSSEKMPKKDGGRRI